jgi:hypothetical protein
MPRHNSSCWWISVAVVAVVGASSGCAASATPASDADPDVSPDGGGIWCNTWLGESDGDAGPATNRCPVGWVCGYLQPPGVSGYHCCERYDSLACTRR